MNPTFKIQNFINNNEHKYEICDMFRKLSVHFIKIFKILIIRSHFANLVYKKAQTNLKIFKQIFFYKF